MYRGILMPLSSDGSTIDFVYGVMNWKELAHVDVSAALAVEMNGFAVEQSIMPVASAPVPIWADGPSAAAISLAIGHSSKTGGSDPAGELIHRLVRARDSAEPPSAAAGRFRVALYRPSSEGR